MNKTLRNCLIALALLVIILCACAGLPQTQEYHQTDWRYRIHTCTNDVYLANSYTVNTDGTLTISSCAKVMIFYRPPIQDVPFEITRYNSEIVISKGCYVIEPNKKASIDE